MKILSAAQMREWDRFTIKEEPITSLALMERASQKCVDWIDEHFHHQHFSVFCGPGNNGGDGLCIARMLKVAGKDVTVFVAGNETEFSDDFSTNFQRLVSESGIVPVQLDAENPQPSLNKESIIIDCLFGTGLNRTIQDWRTGVIAFMNECDHPIVSIDLPSGIIPDLIEIQAGPVIKATVTLTFQQPKLAFFFQENQQYTGRFEVLDIGLYGNYTEQITTSFFATALSDASLLLIERPRFSHKNMFGHLDVFGGSKGMLGAAILISRAALRTGCGLVTAHVPQCAFTVFQSAIPEVMCIAEETETHLSTSRIDNNKSAAAIGPGLGQFADTGNFVRLLLEECSIPLVLDADALNLISSGNHQSRIPKNSIITPHPGEFDRLFGKHINTFERFKTQQTQSISLQIYIVLKGAFTSVSTPKGIVFFNTTGNNAMSTAGSGDVLTGIIGSLLAQGYVAEDAAVLGTFLHGLAGDIARDKIGSQGLLAGDIAENIPAAIDKVRDSVDRELRN